MGEAELYQQLGDGRVQCRICAHQCAIAPGLRGRCGVRRNDYGKLVSLVYGRAAAVNVDPIEKKPLFHFLPATKSLSVGTVGCNFRCGFCQNWELSRGADDTDPRLERALELEPKALVEHCANRGIPSISFTYNEPTVFFEYALDTARLAHGQGIRTVFVSNGYQSQLALETLAPALDAINVDLKAYSQGFYSEYCKADLQPVLDTIALAHELGIWLEVTTLIIPCLNDDEGELTAAARHLAGIDPNIPWHVTAFHPDYQMTDRWHTPPAALYRAYHLGRQAGLNHVYVGNLQDTEHSSTYCPHCGVVLVRRSWHTVELNQLRGDRCGACDTVIAGVWS